jgi:hypothetical protein
MKSAARASNKGLCEDEQSWGNCGACVSATDCCHHKQRMTPTVSEIIISTSASFGSPDALDHPPSIQCRHGIDDNRFIDWVWMGNEAYGEPDTRAIQMECCCWLNQCPPLDTPYLVAGLARFLHVYLYSRRLIKQIYMSNMRPSICS